MRPSEITCCVQENAIKMVADKGVDGLPWLLLQMPDLQLVMLVATKVLTAKMAYIKRQVDACTKRAACEWADNRKLWMLARMLELPAAADKDSFFSGGCPANRRMSLPY